MKQAKTCLALVLSVFALHASALTLSVNSAARADAKGGFAVQTGSSGLYSAMLPGNIVYWRAESFTQATTWNDVAAMTNPAAGTAHGLILDLRSNTSPEDFDGAVRVAGLLAKGQNSPASVFHPAAFQPAGHPSMAMLIVLINRETRGAAETLAGALQSQGALVMGEATQGAHAVTPDVTTTASARDEALSLALIDRQQVDAVIAESAARHRMSEAALVRGQDPEQDAFIAAHEQAVPAALVPATRDIALVEALDSFKAIRVVEGQESSPQTRVADTSSVAGGTVIASSGLGR